MMITEAFKLLYYNSREYGTELITEKDRYWYSYYREYPLYQGGYYIMPGDLCPNSWEKYS